MKAAENLQKETRCPNTSLSVHYFRDVTKKITDAHFQDQPMHPRETLCQVVGWVCGRWIDFEGRRFYVSH